MRPPPPICPPIRLTLPLDATIAFQCLDEISGAMSPKNQSSTDPASRSHALSPAIKRLENYASQFLGECSLSDLETSKSVLDSIFARTTEVTLQLAPCILSSSPIIDTLQTRTLKAYIPDWNGNSLQASAVRNYLQELLRIEPESWIREQEVLDVDLEDTRDKSRLIEAIREIYQLDRLPELQKQNGNRLLSRLFPELEDYVTECDVIVTKTLFFFALPKVFWEEEPNEKTPENIRAFRLRIKKFKQWQFSQFPMFGFLRGDDVDPSFVEQIADLSGLAPSYIRRELGRVIGFLPVNFVERYLVHDVWGHGWQASMLRLEGLYQQLAVFDQNFDWNSVVVRPDRTKLRLCDCLQRQTSGWRIRDEVFAEYLSLWIWNRIATAMAPLIAELVADLFEHKLFWTHPHLYDYLQTTSILPEEPAKLDLMLEDLCLYFNQIFKAIDLFCQRQSYRQRFISEMMADGISREDAEFIAEELRSRIKAWRDQQFASQRVCMTGKNEIEVNLYGYLEHHVALLAAISSILARELADKPTDLAGMRRWNDWFSLLIAVYFEQDPTDHFWKLPWFLLATIGRLTR